jgi:hypothetical protein
MLVSAADTPEKVAQTVWHDVLICLAEQKEKENGPA